MSGGIQGIDTKGIEKILAKFSNKQIITGIIIGIAITGSFFILQNVFFDDPIIIETINEKQIIRTPGIENPPTSIKVLKTDDGYSVNIVDYISFFESTIAYEKVAEKIIQSP